MKGKNPLIDVIEFTGQKGWVAKTRSVMAELHGALSDLEAFHECYLVFSPKNVTPANSKDYEKALKTNVVEKVAECFVMLDGLGVIFGEEQVANMVDIKGNQIITDCEKAIEDCISVANYMKNFGKNLNVEDNKKS